MTDSWRVAVFVSVSGRMVLRRVKQSNGKHWELGVHGCGENSRWKARGCVEEPGEKLPGHHGFDGVCGRRRPMCMCMVQSLEILVHYQ